MANRIDDVGEGRQDARRTCILYLGPEPRAPGTVAAWHLIFQALDGEKTIADVVCNRRRRVGTIHDSAELVHGALVASDCRRAAIQLMIGAPDQIAATHLLRSRAHVDPNEHQRIGVMTITPTRKARDLSGDGPLLRLFDYRDNSSNVGGIRELQIAGQNANSPVWELLETIREREHVLAMLIPSPPNEPAATAIAWAQWLAALEEEGLITAKRHEYRIAARDLPLPPGFFKPASRIEKLRQLNRLLSDYVAVFEDGAALVKRFIKIFLVLFATAVGGLVGASHTSVLQDEAQSILKKLIGR